MSSSPPLSRVEAVAASLVVAPGVLVVSAYTLDRCGLRFLPWPMLGIAVLALIGTGWPLWRQASRDAEGFLSWSALTLGVFAWLMWLARPDWLPLATGPDLTHHLQLIRYLDEHWRLVHDPGVEAFLGEMTYYTPGSHLLASLAGAWTGSSGLHALQPVLSAMTALKVGFVFLIARRVLPASPAQNAVAAGAALSLFASQTFFLGSFLEYGFVAQIAAELFVIFSWWTLTIWDQMPERRWLVMFGLAAAAIFLTWPVLIGAPLLLFGMLSLLPRSLSVAERLVQALIAGALPLLYAGMYLFGRAAFVQMAGTGGKTASPDVGAYGWCFLVASTTGLLWSVTRRRSRSVGLMAASILVEAAALYGLAVRQHNTPYMALKLFYVLLYVQAVGVAVAAGLIWSLVKRRRSALAAWTAWMATAVVALLAAVSVAAAPKRLAIHIQPAISSDMERAGEWARTRLPAGCIEYLVGDDETAYWLHLAVLGNPRMSERTANFDTYELNPALLRWLTPGGLPYAIVDIRAVPRGVRDELDVLASFGTAAVARRRGPSACAPR